MQLTENYLCYVTKDGGFFAIQNTTTGVVDAGYRLSERAFFVDKGVKYSITMTKSNTEKAYHVDCKEEK